MSANAFNLDLTYGSYRLYDRRGTWYVDYNEGKDRSRMSLGTGSKNDAIELVKELDRKRAVSTASSGTANPQTSLSLEDGSQLYLTHVGRSKVVGGAKPITVQRYRAILDKFAPFCQSRGITTWQQVTSSVLEKYVTHLQDEHYGERTLYQEATVIKQVVKYFIKIKRLPPDAAITLYVNRPQGTNAFCPTKADVDAIISHCGKNPRLHWLRDLVLCLATTGTRISEAIALEWQDLQQTDSGRFLTIRDDTGTPQARGRKGPPVRTTKSGRSRRLPVNAALASFLERRAGEGPAPQDLLLKSFSRRKIDDDKVRRALKKVTRELLNARQVPQPRSPRQPSAQTQAGAQALSPELDRLTPHSFRHYFISEAASSGVALNVLMTWVGHRDSKLVRHYFHLHDHTSQVAMNSLSLVGDFRTHPVSSPGRDVPSTQPHPPAQPAGESVR